MLGRTFRKRLESGEVLLGVTNHYPSPAILETMCRGWDFVWIDAQHGLLSYENALAATRVASGMGLETMLRVESRDPDLLGKYADIASSALMIPLVNNAREAEAVVRAIRFPPRGERSFGGRRIGDVAGPGYQIGDQPLLVAQIETPEAARNCTEIIEVDGVDSLFFGPDDMRMRMGISMDQPMEESPALMEAMANMGLAARAAGKSAGGIAFTAEWASRFIQMGYQILVGGADVKFIREGNNSQLAELKPIVQRIR